MKQFMIGNVLTMTVSLLLGVSIGMGGFLLYVAPKDDSSEYFCFKGALSIMPKEETMVMGEQVVCAKDWTLSNKYGPVGVLQDELDKGTDTKIKFSTLESIKRKYQDRNRQKMSNEGLLRKN